MAPEGPWAPVGGGDGGAGPWPPWWATPRRRGPRPPRQCVGSPSGGFPSQPAGQLCDILGHARPSRSAGVGPAPGDGPRVPSQQRLGSHEEDATPAGPRQHPANRGQEGPLGRPGLGSVDLAAKYGHPLSTTTSSSLYSFERMARARTRRAQR